MKLKEIKTLKDVILVVNHVHIAPLLQKLQGDTFHSKSNKMTFKIRQHINCKSQNVIYLVTCAKCNKQGVEHSMQFSKRMSSYFSHIKSGTRDCEISCHFTDDHQDTWVPNYQENTDFLIQGIGKLENPPRSKKALEQRLRDFKGYWQMKLNTMIPHGLNIRNELKEAFLETIQNKPPNGSWCIFFLEELYNFN